MSVSEYIRKRLIDLLNDHRMVVWYDAEQAFEGFLAAFKAPGCVIVSASSSILRARREAEAVYRKMNDSARPAEARANLLLYVPRARGSDGVEWPQDPFAAFAVGGIAFGDKDAERLESIARQAAPAQADQITRLFAEGRPTLAMLDRLQQASASPMLREAIGTESPSEAIALVVCDEAKAKRVEQVEGCTAELLRMLEARAGFRPAGKTRSFPTIRKQLGTYVLVSELALDLPQAMPDSLSAVPRATAAFKEVIYAACDRMRSDTSLRDTYVDLATQIEAELRLAELIETTNLGQRDTFPFEERRYLTLANDAAGKGDMAKAREIIEARRSSVWRVQGERVVLWNAASRCVDLLAVAESIAGTWKEQAKDLSAVISAYTREGGWAELDRRQRLFEHVIAACPDDREIASLVELCRRQYRDLAKAIQGRFLTLVQDQGWPPAGMAKQTQVFDRFVAPLLEKNARVAYFMVDACRFEMGRDLGTALAEQGQVQMVAVAGTLPASTAFGMAALLPGADQMLRIGEINGEFLPVLGQRTLRDLNDRMGVLRDRYGDRFGQVTLEDLLGKSRTVRERAKKTDLLVVLTPDPDQIAESLGNLRARRHLSDTTVDITHAVRRLAELGFQHVVIVADHGHILVDEILAGETVNEPGGDWKLRKRRCLLGKAHSREPGTLVLKAAQMGMRGDVEDFCVPAGLGVFRARDGYFHEGLSLQENILPVVTVELKQAPAEAGGRSIEIRYRRDVFTTRAIGLTLQYTSLFTEPVRVRVEAYDGTTAKAKVVGKVADCDALDHTTREVVLRPNTETSVPVLLNQDFSGPSIEIRATDAQGVVWARKLLKNQMLD